jgi:hypothetical protein
MMGPFVMAGLTHDSRVLVADPANIAQYIGEVAPEDDTVSWEVRGCWGPVAARGRGRAR